jgi:hypothetical protein
MSNEIKSARRRRWTRTQRFALTEAGLAAEADFRATIAESRAHAGRASFDEAREAWGRQFGVPADDATFLSELRGGACSSAALVAALDVCGKTREDVLAGLERLAEAGLIAES